MYTKTIRKIWFGIWIWKELKIKKIENGRKRIFAILLKMITFTKTAEKFWVLKIFSPNFF
jgi:hypothetical protein